LEYPPSNKRAHLRLPILVTQVKMGEGKRFFFGYAKNISRAGIFIQTVSPKDVGNEFNIEFMLPKTETTVKCRCKVIWSRVYKKASTHEPGMGLAFLDLDPETAEKVEQWVIEQQKHVNKSGYQV